MKLEPKLLSYIFGILIKVLAWKREGHSLNLTLSRMADWTEYGEIIARCMGYKVEEFLTAYYNNIKLQTEEVLESSPVAVALIEFTAVLEEKSHSDSATKWLSLLEIKANVLGINTKGKFWPKSASHLSRRLKELVTTLREIGIEIEWSTDSKTKIRTITVRKLPLMPAPPLQKENQSTKI